MSSSSPLIIALDYPDADAALAMARRLDPALVRVKVGKELFTATGPAVLDELHALGFQVFLDLKFHDIPNTVAGAVRAAAARGVWMVNVHAGGGSRMMTAAREAAAEAGTARPLVTAVTVLTHLDATELHETGITDPAEVQVHRLARLAQQAGLDGVVCSAREAEALRADLGADFRLVCPGIRPAGSGADDQSRVQTPSVARAAGVDDLVIGRPVTQAADPAGAVDAILAELNFAL